jgi:GAF domain-containing protein
MATSGGRGEPSSSYTGEVSADDLAVTLSLVARSLQDESSVQGTLDAIASAAVDTVPGARYAGLMLVRARRHIDTRAGTDDVVQLVDQAQFDTGEGPCLSAIFDQRTVRVANMSAEPRWPRFAARAIALGVRSMLSFQLFVEHDNLGALNLYADSADAFTDESEHVGLLFAAHAAVAMSDAQRLEQLDRAAEVRDLIGQAKGILMERHKLTAIQAFEALVRASQRTNTKLVDVARHLANTGELGAGNRPRRAS